MTGIIVDIREYVLECIQHTEVTDLTGMEQRLVITALLETALGSDAGIDDLHRLIELGLAVPHCGFVYSTLRGRYVIHLLQHRFHAEVTTIAWNCFRNTAMLYSVSVESGKVTISTRPPCLDLSPYQQLPN